MRLMAAIVTETTDLNSTEALKGLDKAKSKLMQLEDAVEKAWAGMKSRRQALPEKTNFYQQVFLAPEYFFSNQRYANDRFFDHTTKRHVISTLAALARNYPELLIIPGTVLWTKNAYKTPWIRAEAHGAPNAPRYQVDVKRSNNALARIGGISKTKFQEASNTPGWSHQGPYDGQESSYNLPYWYLKEADKHQTRIAQNVAYVCLGDKILKYAKVGNFQEVEGESGTIVFAPGNIEGKFTIGTVKYSIEICRDHLIGVIDKSATGNDAHVRIIVSSYIDNEKASIMNNAIVLHASTEKHGEYRTNPSDNSLFRVGTDPVRIKKDSGCKLIAFKDVTSTCRLYDIEVDDKTLGIGKAPIKFTSSVISPVQHVH